MLNDETKSTNPHRNLILIAVLLLCVLDKPCRVNPEPSPGPAARPAPALTAHRSAPCAPLPSTVRGRGRPQLRARAQSSVVPAAIRTPPSLRRSTPKPGSALAQQTGPQLRIFASTRYCAAS